MCLKSSPPQILFVQPLSRKTRPKKFTLFGFTQLKELILPPKKEPKKIPRPTTLKAPQTNVPNSPQATHKIKGFF